MRKVFFLGVLAILSMGCNTQQPDAQLTSETEVKTTSYLDYSGRDDILSGGVKMIPITTPKGEFKVWTKRIGNNPTMKVLLLHGGPGAPHDIYEVFDSFFPNAQIEYYYYDQLECGNSDQPNDPDLWTIEHFVEEVEQVRRGLGLDSSNFYLYGASWGGMLAQEYALKYQEHLKGLILSNTVASSPEYNKYVNEVLAKQMPEGILKEIKALEASEEYTNPRYMELLVEHFYTKHVLRKPWNEWPEPVMRSLNNIDHDIYVAMQGPSEFGMTGDVVLKTWDVSDRLPEISVPTLLISAEFDTAPPKHIEWMASQVQNGTYFHCPNAGHLASYDTPDLYFSGMIDFIKKVDAEKREVASN